MLERLVELVLADQVRFEELAGDLVLQGLPRMPRDEGDGSDVREMASSCKGHAL